MLIEFSVRNYRSFKDQMTLSLQATPLISKEKNLDENAIFDADSLRLLTSTGIYGANASGKSNLADALAFMRNFVLQSSKDSRANEPILVKPFALSTDTNNAPTEFEVVFLTGGIQYRYGFEVTTSNVTREWLYFVPEKKEVRLFEREGQIIQISPIRFKEGKEFTDKTRANALFLSVVAQFNGEIAISILSWFDYCQVITGLRALNINIIASLSYQSLRQDEQFARKIVNFVKSFDTGIEDIVVQKSSEPNIEHIISIFNETFEMKDLDKMRDQLSYQVKSIHTVYSQNGEIIGSVPFDLLEDESEGTKKLFALAGLIILVLQAGLLLVIDEYDARLHPMISREIVRLFNSKKTNPNHAQLVFMTHDTNLLNRDLLRRDQIWFVEKDRYGASHLYSLAELKVRNDASFESDYITGRYGAIPFLGDLRYIVEDIMGETHAKETQQ